MHETIDSMRTEIQQLRDRVQVLKDQLAREQRQNTPRVGYQSYFLVSFAVLRPFAHTFPFSDAGLGPGASIGTGRYLSPSHVLELTADYDLYLSATLRYRYEFRPGNAPFAFGLILGVKQKLLSVLSWGDYIGRNDLISSTYLLLGTQLNFPFGKDSFAVEVNYLHNRESVMLAAFSLQIFL